MLSEFDRTTGLRQVACPSCQATGAASLACANCGGSGHLWASPNSGTLADSGLTRLHDLLARERATRADDFRTGPGLPSRATVRTSHPLRP
jgi:hypothetical protein